MVHTVIMFMDGTVLTPVCTVEGEVTTWPNPGMTVYAVAVRADTPGEAVAVAMRQPLDGKG